MNRNRLYYAFFVGITIFTGLASRHFAFEQPVWVRLYFGDALWALMVFLLFGLIFRRRPSLWIAIATLVFSYSIELSQLYHAAWIDAVRVTRLGGLVLGFGFLWSDILSYTVGVGFGFGMELLFLKNKIQRALVKR